LAGFGAWATALNLTDPPLAKALAGVIRRRRERLKLSLNQLAKQSGVTRQMISCIERDKNVPSVSTVARIAVGLEIPYDVLNRNAVRWLARQPAQCRACKYICISFGELRWLNRQRVCIRPKDWKP
jgi:transcriptional regulator with XRE-family HTH domain